MTRNRRIGVYMLALVVVVIALFLFGARDAGETHVDIRGSITTISPSIDTSNMFILVEGELGPDTGFDKASIRVEPNNTDIYKMQGSKKVKASIADLQLNLIVEVDFGDNPVAESYPVQTKAKSITILE